MPMPRMARFNYIVPGIFDQVNNPGDWDYQAQAWLNAHGLGDAAGFNYADDMIGGNMALSRQAQAAAADLLKATQAYRGELGGSVVAVGHSNGCRILCEAIFDEPGIVLDELHLIAAACSDDCDVNFLNAAANHGQIKRVVLYVSPVDDVLALAPLAGYGDLGRAGPSHIGTGLSPVLTIITRQCGHSDWVSGDFEATMELIAGGWKNQESA